MNNLKLNKIENAILEYLTVNIGASTNEIANNFKCNKNCLWPYIKYLKENKLITNITKNHVDYWFLKITYKKKMY